MARGGGSLEDLWGFNEENVVRAAAASDIPLISAVGHETDTTLIDYASDMRAPTPTAAAELAVPVRVELLAWVEQQGSRLTRALTGGLAPRKQRIADLGRALPQPEALLETPRQRLDYVTARLPRGLQAAIAQKRVRLAQSTGALRPNVLGLGITDMKRRLDALSVRLPTAHAHVMRRAQDKIAGQSLRKPDLTRQGERLHDLLRQLSHHATRQQAERIAKLTATDRLRETLGYRETLKRGYAVVRGDGQVVTDTASLKKARDVDIEFADGHASLSNDPQGRLL